MQFTIDTVTEFTFLENLLLGLGDELHDKPGVKKTLVKRSRPLCRTTIQQWEESNGVTLPSDLREFYNSSNGFNFQWKYSFGGDGDDNTAVCKIDLNPLENVTQVYGYETSCNPGIKVENQRYVIKLAPGSKLFELAKVSNVGKVVLVYLYTKYIPTIWLLITPIELHYLTDTIAKYLIMSVVHLGIPNWQLKCAKVDLPQWSENIFRMLAPHLLDVQQTYPHPYEAQELNKLDPNLINILPMSSLCPELPNEADVTVEEKAAIKKTPRITPVHSKKDVKKTHKSRKPLYYIKKR